MKNIAIIFAADLSPYAFRPVVESNNSFSQVLTFADSLPDIQKSVVLCSPEFQVPDGYESVEKEVWTVDQLILTFRDLCPENGNIFYMFGDCPLLNIEIAERMYKNHFNYLAQYTFADGYPLGLTPEIITYEIIEAMQVLSKDMKEPVKRDSVFKIIEKDINAFDLETELAPKDMRLYRLSFTADNKRNFNIVSAFIKEGAVSEDEIIEAVLQKQELQRNIPAYFPIQITEGCPQSCTFCPYPQMIPGHLNSTASMSSADFKTILKKISTISEDAVIGLSLWGEPSLHPEIAEMAAAVLEYPGFNLVIETSGLNWPDETVQKIMAANRSRIVWIISLETMEKAVYKKLRGEGFDEALAFSEKMVSEYSEQVYIQAVRMVDSEEWLEQFYRYWKEKTEHIIIQKYDHFSLLLQEKKVTDLSPLVRMPCWHIKRDMPILLNGDVPQCREDVKGENILGNALTEDIDKIWEKGEILYKRHISGNLPEICINCDEFYTYNF